MAENLKATSFNDGHTITEIVNNNSWIEFTSAAYCWYNNDPGNKNIYGALYNWFAVSTGRLCPQSWHVPSSDEWDIMVQYLDLNAKVGMVEQSIIAGGKLKETGTAHWTLPNPATNETGFSALPGGWRSNTGFIYLGSFGYWHTSSEYRIYDGEFVGIRNIRFINTSIYRDTQNYPKWVGQSVRCIKD